MRSAWRQFDIELAGDLVPHRARHPDPPRVAQAFDPCRDIDAVAVDRIAVDDHLAEIDPHSQPDALRVWPFAVVSLDAAA